MPAFGRNQENDFDSNEMSLTWKMLNASSQYFLFQINFSHPEKISPLADAPDKLKISFKGAE